MAAFKVRKFKDPEALERFLNGGIQGGARLLGGVYNLEGKTLIFNNPSATVTFTAGAMNGKHTVAEILTQIGTGTSNAVVAGITGENASLTLIEASPSTGIDVDKTGTANGLLGFSADDDTAGAVYAFDPTPTPPCFVAFTHDAPSNSLVLTTWE